MQIKFTRIVLGKQLVETVGRLGLGAFLCFKVEAFPFLVSLSVGIIKIYYCIPLTSFFDQMSCCTQYDPPLVSLIVLNRTSFHPTLYSLFSRKSTVLRRIRRKQQIICIKLTKLDQRSLWNYQLSAD